MEKEGLTCAACLTLNPVGAPACVRCNAPLVGPAGPPAQPQQYPPVPPPSARPPQQSRPTPPVVPQQPVPPGPVPAEQYAPESGGHQLTPLRRRQRRRLLLIGNLVVLLLLVGGAVALWQTRPRYLDTGAVARTLSDRLSAQVTCPGKVKRAAGTRFSCSVVYAVDRRGSVTVTVTNNAGAYTWKAGRQHR